MKRLTLNFASAKEDKVVAIKMSDFRSHRLRKRGIGASTVEKNYKQYQVEKGVHNCEIN
jgi:hypothetical protein